MGDERSREDEDVMTDDGGEREREGRKGETDARK